MTQNERDLITVLKNLIAGRGVYRSKPIGAPGSVARIEQEEAIKLEDEALAVISRVTGEKVDCMRIYHEL